MVKPNIKTDSKKSKNTDAVGRKRNYEFIVEYNEPVKPKKVNG